MADKELHIEKDLLIAKLVVREEAMSEAVVSLVALHLDQTLKTAWRERLYREHTTYLARIRLRPNGAFVSSRIWFEHLYDATHRGNEEAYPLALLERFAEFPRKPLPMPAVAQLVRKFYAELSIHLEGGDPAEGLIGKL